jgi:hypothetical protein
MIGLEALEEFFHYTPSQYPLKNSDPANLIGYSPSIDPPYPVYGGLFEKEAIMLLRRFYIQENEKGRGSITHTPKVDLLIPFSAPNPRPKKNRELNTRFEDGSEEAPTR